MDTAYHKINGIFKRDDKGKFIIGEWAQPEFEYLADLTWEFTEKVDGTNIRLDYIPAGQMDSEMREQEKNTIFNPDGSVVFVNGRTNRADIPRNLFAAISSIVFGSKYHYQAVFGDTPATIYGEGYGGKIQAGGNYRPDESFVAFDIRIGRFWLKRDDVIDICKHLNLPYVPVLDDFRGFSLNEAIMEIDDMANGVTDVFESNWTGVKPEGVIAVPQVNLLDRSGKRIITKIKLKDFEI